MELFLHQDGDQVGPYTADQIAEAVASGQLSRDDIVWHEGLTEWQPIRQVISLPSPVDPLPPSRSITRPSPDVREVNTNVKQGAIIGGWVCFGLGLVCMVWSLFLFFLYGPFFLVAFILSIVAMSQRRVLGGVSLLVATLVVPSVLGIVLFATRTVEFADGLSKSLEESAEERSSSGATQDQPSEPREGIADAMRRSIEDGQRASDQKRLEELRDRRANFQQKLTALEDFSILHASFSREANAIGLREPIIELTVENNTNSSVRRAYFRGVLSSPGRSIPWVDDTFNYEISGGVEPGERATWRLAPNMFGDWGRADPPDDAVFEVTVIRLDGPDGEELFGNARFSENDEKRLAELEEKFGSESGPRD